MHKIICFEDRLLPNNIFGCWTVVCLLHKLFYFQSNYLNPSYFLNLQLQVLHNARRLLNIFIVYHLKKMGVLSLVN
jgi:hypothetical protein